MNDRMLRHAILADFLRTRRQNLQPDQVGFSQNRARTRRTSGLRREELAELAGISTDWYARLEQGRPIHVSVQVLGQLAAVLQLSPAEQDYLFTLGQEQPGDMLHPSSVPVTDALHEVVEAHGHLPAYLLGPQFQYLVWYRAAIDVLGDFARYPEQERNALWFMFTDETKHRLVDWETHARHLVAEFRAHTSRYVGEPWFSELVTRLAQQSAEFGEWWARHDVGRRSDILNEIRHPLVGRLVIRGCMLTFSDRPGLRLAIYTPVPHTGTEELLWQLANQHVRGGFDSIATHRDSGDAVACI